MYFPHAFTISPLSFYLPPFSHRIPYHLYRPLISLPSLPPSSSLRVSSCPFQSNFRTCTYPFFSPPPSLLLSNAPLHPLELCVKFFGRFISPHSLHTSLIGQHVGLSLVVLFPMFCVWFFFFCRQNRDPSVTPTPSGQEQELSRSATGFGAGGGNPAIDNPLATVVANCHAGVGRWAALRGGWAFHRAWRGEQFHWRVPGFLPVTKMHGEVQAYL